MSSGDFSFMWASEMSRQKFAISYSRTVAADDHTMDVESLAPALLAVGRLIREANQQINGKETAAKVVVVSDFEAKCFNIDFETIISGIQHVQVYLGLSDIKNAKDILEYIGLIKETKSLGISLLAFLKLKKGREIESVTEIKDEDFGGLISVNISGEKNSVVVNNHIYQMSENTKILKATRDIFTPLGTDDFDRVEFKENDDVQETITLPDVEDIVSSCNQTLQELGEEKPDTEIKTTWLSVYSPVYDKSADKWRFTWGSEHIYVDISETSIVEDALARGGAFANDSYQVLLEVTTPRDRAGKQGRPTYKILEVIKFVPAPIQQELFRNPKEK